MKRLLIRPGAIGDLVVSLPALEYLGVGCDLEVWVAERNVPLIRFAKVHSIGSTGLDLLEFQPSPLLIERLRGFDSIVSWYGSNRPEFREAVARLRLPFHFLPALPADNTLHAVDFYARQVSNPRADCQSVCASWPEFPAGADLSRFIQKPIENRLQEEILPYAVIHPFASNAKKRWPLEKFQEVARQLKIPVRWCAGPEEALPGAVRIDNLFELACWLARARVFIGNDSGISHLAAAAGAPTIVLFGPTDPEVWAPRRSRVLYPMNAIEPAAVIVAVEDL